MACRAEKRPRFLRREKRKARKKGLIVSYYEKEAVIPMRQTGKAA